MALGVTHAVMRETLTPGASMLLISAARTNRKQTASGHKLHLPGKTVRATISSSAKNSRQAKIKKMESCSKNI